MKLTYLAVLAAATLGAATLAAQADVTLVSDGFNRTGNLNGSTADSGQTWSAYSSGYSGGDANGSANYTPVITPATDGANANFSGTTYHENTEGYVPFTASSSGLLTATAVISSQTGASNSWAFLGLSTGTSATPDVYNAGSMVAWMLVKYPAYNSANYGAQLFIGAGTSTSGGAQVNYSSSLAEETVEITQDPVTGAINAYADGTLIGSGTSTAVANGLVIGDRAGSSSSATAPGVGSFDSVSVSQAPEPASLSLLAVGAVGMLARRRRR